MGIKFCSLLVLATVTLLVNSSVTAKDLDKKKDELKKIYQAGGISKAEYENTSEFLEKSDQEKSNIIKQSFALKKPKKEQNQIKLENQINIFKKDTLFGPLKKEDKELEKITLEKIEELGKPEELDDSYFTKGMIEKFGGCGNSFECKGATAGQQLFRTFNQSKSYGQKNPGEMIKAMAMYEVFYASKLWEARTAFERYKKNNYNKVFWPKENDEKQIRSLFGMNKGKKAMRSALGMNLETPTKEAINKFWLLGEFLDLGTGVDNKKLAQDLKKRQELLEAYKVEIVNLKKKLQDDLDKE